ALAILHYPRPQGVPEKIELRVRILAFALTVLAVNNLGLVRMHLQTTLPQPRVKRSLDRLRFLLSTAMHKSIIRIPAPGSIRKRSPHPDIECVMHKQVSHHRTDHTTLRRPPSTFYSGSVC